MAKKAAVQQLQAELNNDEDFEKFLKKYPEALLVLDVYSEWSGPCISLINALKKIKLELGGEKLQLAICKSDYITKLRRFRGKSEPTWLFVRSSRSINLMFGSNMPKLMQMIKTELHALNTPISGGHSIKIEELHPEEQTRENIKNELLEAEEQSRRQKREKRRKDYLMSCTDIILENLPGVGVCIFGPQVQRDMFKKINEPAEVLKISCKDRHFQNVSKADFETINFACTNPLSEEIIEQLTKQEILICFWKIPDETNSSVSSMMSQYVHELTSSRVEPPDEYNSHERVLPPILSPMRAKILYDVEDHVICPPDEEEKDQQRKRFSSTAKFVDEVEPAPAAEEEEAEDQGEGELELGASQPPELEMPAFDIPPDVVDSEHEAEEENPEPAPEEPPPKKTCTRSVIVPPVWVPNDDRTHATLIYVFFRAQTITFLPPDPTPNPPAIIMAYETHKKHDLISFSERNKSEIPCYGFFTSDDPDEAQLIANSVQEYNKYKHSPDDKLVFKVIKRTSNMMLSLASYGATYVSANTKDGKRESKIFFPEGYKTDEQERLEAQEEEGGDGETILQERAASNVFQPTVEEEETEGEEVGEGPDLSEATELGEGPDYGEVAELGEFDAEVPTVEEQ